MGPSLPHGRPSVLRRLHAERSGSIMLEHALLLAAFTLPMYLALMAGIRNLGVYYGMLTYSISQPLF